MNVAVYFTPLGLNAGDLAGRGVVVIDVLRATTSVITALANGAKAVIPAATSEEAVRLASNLEKDGVLLAGERKVLKIEGFALGNSPVEMTAAAGARGDRGHGRRPGLSRRPGEGSAGRRSAPFSDGKAARWRTRGPFGRFLRLDLARARPGRRPRRSGEKDRRRVTALRGGGPCYPE